MDKDEEIKSLYSKIWWKDMQFKARESYLLYKIEKLEEELAYLKAKQNSFGDK